LVVFSWFAESAHFIPDGDDMKFYSDWGRRIATGELTDHKAFYGLPGYAFCLAAIYKVAGLDRFLVSLIVGLVQALMDAGVAALLYKISATTFAPGPEEKGEPLAEARPHVIGYGAAFLWIVFTPAQAFSMILMPTIWLILAYYLCVWWALKTQKSTWWWPWLGLGTFVGVVAMLIATIFFALFFFVVAIFLSVDRSTPAFRKRLPRILAAVGVLMGGVLLGVSPAWAHNRFLAGDSVLLSAHSGVNFWIGNNPESNGYPKMPPGIRTSQEGMLKDSITVAEKDAGRPLKRGEVSRYWSTKADAFIHEGKGRLHFNPVWLRLLKVKFDNFWNAFQYDDVGAIKRLRDDGILPPGLRFGFIAALGLAGMLPAILLFPRSRWVAAAVVLHMCALMSVFVTERYRMAAAPGLMILGFFGVWQLWLNLVRGHWIGAGAYMALAVGASYFVSIPRTDPGNWALDFYNAGTRAFASSLYAQAEGRNAHEQAAQLVGPEAEAKLREARERDAFSERELKVAQQNFETAAAYVPANSDFYFALANIWLEKSGREKDPRLRDQERTLAKVIYELIVTNKPDHASALSNLGVLALEEKQWADAEKWFRASIKAEPDDAKTYYLVALTRFQAGQREAAREPLEMALKLKPDQKEFLTLKAEIEGKK
jgi:Tfp pilus assembly protein PilF